MPKDHPKACETCWYKLEGYWEMKRQIAYLLNELIKLKQQLEELQKEFHANHVTTASDTSLNVG
jgi:hypothetical protein